ncbi:hypothetical protein HRbin35_00461 [bacterium HR35]|nr:hypothetical protein HRbin35_00461 [bacterium HR35]
MFELVAQISTSTFPSLPPILCADKSFLDCFFSIFETLLVYVSVIAVGFSALMLAWAGFLYMSQGDKSENVQKVNQRILWAIIGLVVALLAFAIVKLIAAILGAGFINFVFAEQLPEYEPPESISCGGIEIPSVFQTSTLPLGSWSLCFIYLIYLAISLLYKAVFVASVVLLVWTGFNYIARPEKSQEVHKNFLYIFIGIIISFASFTIVKLIERFFFSLE